MRLLAYAINSIGIGHLSRLIAITDAIRRLNQNVEILFLTEISDSRLLQSYNFPYYYIPPKKKLQSDLEYKNMDIVKMEKLRKTMVQQTAKIFQPNIVLHDSLIDEILYSAGVSKKLKQVFITRWRNNMGEYLIKHNTVLSNMDLFVLTENETICSVVPNELKLYCSKSIIRRTVSDINVDYITAKYKIISNNSLITISNGGGAEFKAFEDDFWKEVFQSLKMLDELNITIKIIGITGPMTKSNIVPPKFKNLEVLIIDFEPNLLDLFYVSNLCITRGGYNTVNELKSINANAICIPAKRFSDNQSERIMHAQKEARNIHYCELDKDKLFQLITLIQSKPKEQKNLVPADKDMELYTKLKLANRILNL